MVPADAGRKYLELVKEVKAGVTKFRTGQLYVTHMLVLGHANLYMIAATGHGKSLPMLVALKFLQACPEKKTVILLTPLVSLKAQLTRQFIEAGLNVLDMCSGCDINLLAEATKGVYDVVVTTPEKLLHFGERSYNSSETGLDIMIQNGLHALWIDEVHCMRDRGRKYEAALRMFTSASDSSKSPHHPKIFGCTATPFSSSESDFHKRLFNLFPGKNCDVLRTSIYRPGLHLDVSVTSTEKNDLDLIAREVREVGNRGRSMVMVESGKTLDAVASRLRSDPTHKFHVYTFSSPRNKSEKDQRQQQSEWNLYMSDTRTSVVAVVTHYLQYGIDLPDIACMVLYSPIGHMDDVAQRIGRAGRGICTARAIVRIASGRLNMRLASNKNISQSQQTEDTAAAAQVIAWAHSTTCYWESLCKYYGESQILDQSNNVILCCGQCSNCVRSEEQDEEQDHTVEAGSIMLALAELKYYKPLTQGVAGTVLYSFLWGSMALPVKRVWGADFTLYASFGSVGKTRCRETKYLQILQRLYSMKLVVEAPSCGNYATGL